MWDSLSEIVKNKLFEHEQHKHAYTIYKKVYLYKESTGKFYIGVQIPLFIITITTPSLLLVHSHLDLSHASYFSKESLCDVPAKFLLPFTG